MKTLKNLYIEQAVEEFFRVDYEFNDLTENAKHQAILNNDLYNKTWDTNHQADQWIWQYDEFANILTRKHLK